MMAIIVAAGNALVRRSQIRPVAGRLMTALLAVLAGAVLVLYQAPECLHGAFAVLDPMVREFWFDRTMEGLPVWSVPLAETLPNLLAILAGLFVFIIIFRSNIIAQRQDRIMLLMLFLGSALVGLTVVRTLVYPLCLSAIMLAAIARSLFAAAESRTNIAVRMLLQIAAFAFLQPILFGQMVSDRLLAATQVSALDPGEEQFLKRTRACQKASAAKDLGRLPLSQLMAPLDSSPAILQFTRHKIVATGHHRNQQAMADVIHTYTGSDEQAARILQARSVDYLVGCEDSFELRKYRQRVPQGLWARIYNGNPPRWLVRQPDIGPFHIWRIDWTRS
jgi:hypothetical protein